MKKIIFINNKGGVGKTASVVNVAHMLATVHNKKVLVVDLDPQMNTTTMFLSIDFLKLFTDLYKGKQSFEQASVEDLLKNPEMDVREAVYKTRYENLDIIPAFLTLSYTEAQMMSKVDGLQQFVLKKHLAKIENDYDYCVIDTSPSLSLINVNGLVAADDVYIPVTTDGGSMLGVANTVNVINRVKEYAPQLNLKGMFFARFDKKKNISITTCVFLAKYYGDVILPLKIHLSKNVEEGSIFQRPLLELDPKQKNIVTRQYLQLTGYILIQNDDLN